MNAHPSPLSLLRAALGSRRAKGSGAFGGSGAPDAEGSGAPRAKAALSAVLATAALLLIPANALAAQAPSIDSTFSADVTSSNANLHAKINPGEAETTYHFEYVTQAEFNATEFAKAERTLESASIGADNEDHLATAAIEGLAPQTAYEFRAVATNSVQEVTGPAVAFTTEEAGEPTPNPCPNERLREESNLDPATERPYSTELPDCRAFEMVSPAYKNLSVPQIARISNDGSRLYSTALGVFAGGSSNTSGNGNDYVFARTVAGWQPTALDPPASEIQVSGPLLEPGSFNQAGDLLLSGRPSGTPINDRVLYRRTTAGSFFEIGPISPPGIVAVEEEDNDTNLAEPSLSAGFSPDLSEVFFSNKGEWLWPGDTTGESDYDLYQYDGLGNSEPEPVGVRNEGTVAEAAATAGDPHIGEAAELISDCGTSLGDQRHNGEGESLKTQNAVSSDGRVVFFVGAACGSSPPSNELFARIDRSTTVPISQPLALSPAAPHSLCQSSVCVANITNEESFRDARFEGASADGSIVAFTDTQQLTDEASQDPVPNDSAARSEGCASASGQGGCNLYLYDFDRPEGERLIDVSAGETDSGEPRVQGVGALSEDGSHVYFIAKSVLTEQPNEFGVEAHPGSNNLYDFDVLSGRTTFIATLGTEATEWEPSGLNRQQYPMQTTPDGRFLLFSSEAKVTPDDAAGAAQIFRYDSASGRLDRISIGEGGFNDDGNVAQAPRIPGPLWDFHATVRDPNPAMADDGTTVVFESSAALTQGAANAPAGSKVYEYRRGHVYLIASGPGVELDAIDSSGQNIFFGGAAPLVGQDTDTAPDEYDARAGGGFPGVRQPVECPGDPCQGSAAQPPVLPGPATGAFLGSGNLSAGHRRHHRKHRHHGKHRHRKKNTTHRKVGHN